MLVFPLVRIYLPPRDDAAEFDEGGVDLAGHVDEKEVVLWRKSNKVLPVTWKTRRTGLLHVSGHYIIIYYRIAVSIFYFLQH